MLRLIHAQTVYGAILVDDIDDGLPNKTAHRLGGLGDPNAYARDGYANSPKQPVYIPRVKATEPTVAGFIDLRETQRVLLSSANGKISGLMAAGLISVVSFAETDLITPVVAVGQLGAPAPGDVTITGVGFLSVAPDISSVIFTGVGAVSLNQAQIVAGGGTYTDIQIVIPAVLVPGVQAVNTSVAIRADGLTSAAVALSV